ncbi:hypothetical protein BDP81DRAFT_162976 [Colletotrichum phormii]|uniref:Uncharacterized protein n=1 Tax=Colletotrichum phormii TaxID=359342 RepID=A0AAI9ZY65_9PEZI|nr:uncharacterized protein BDP81DRAFT_162976 [Colletotrichum phormii]KAK1640414.1 hypothetical protein BDP81DRAFT_162976 [Colletotrichum phormii]
MLRRSTHHTSLIVLCTQPRRSVALSKDPARIEEEAQPASKRQTSSPLYANISLLKPAHSVEVPKPNLDISSNHMEQRRAVGASDWRTPLCYPSAASSSWRRSKKSLTTSSILHNHVRSINRAETGRLQPALQSSPLETRKTHLDPAQIVGQARQEMQLPWFQQGVRCIPEGQVDIFTRPPLTALLLPPPCVSEHRFT